MLPQLPELNNSLHVLCVIQPAWPVHDRACSSWLSIIGAGASLWSGVRSVPRQSWQLVRHLFGLLSLGYNHVKAWLLTFLRFLDGQDAALRGYIVIDTWFICQPSDDYRKVKWWTVDHHLIYQSDVSRCSQSLNNRKSLSKFNLC